MKTCTSCLKPSAPTNYYNSSEIDFFPDGKVPVCKQCCFKIIEEKEFEGFQSVMKLINKPIYSDLFNGDFQVYIRMMNSLMQYRDVTFMDSTMFKENIAEQRNIRFNGGDLELSEEDRNRLVLIFGEGYGYEDRDYVYLETEFEDYCNRYEVDSKSLEELIKEIVLTQLDIRKKRAKGEKVNAEQKTLQDLLGSSNLKPVQETGANAVDQESFGTLIKKWENEKPIPEPNEEWKDVDGIGKYVKTFFLGHLAKLFGKEGENPFADEYESEIGKYTVKPPRGDD